MPVQPLRPAQPRTAYDTTREMIIDVGRRVADVRTGIELYRRAAFNAPDGAVLEDANLFGRSCRDLAEIADRARRGMCRQCLSPSAQRAVESYRAYLPILARMARDAEARVRQLATRDSSATRLRRDVLPANNRVVSGLRPYEARLQQVRVAFGWTAPGTPTPRP